MMKKYVNTQVDVDVYQQVKVRAMIKGQTMMELVEDIILDWLGRQDQASVPKYENRRNKK